MPCSHTIETNLVQKKPMMLLPYAFTGCASPKTNKHNYTQQKLLVRVFALGPALSPMDSCGALDHCTA